MSNGSKGRRRDGNGLKEYVYLCMYVFSIIVVDDSNKCVFESHLHLSVSFLTSFLLFSVVLLYGKKGKEKASATPFLGKERKASAIDDY